VSFIEGSEVKLVWRAYWSVSTQHTIHTWRDSINQKESSGKRSIEEIAHQDSRPISTILTEKEQKQKCLVGRMAEVSLD
jgi:hypothetical protein